MPGMQMPQSQQKTPQQQPQPQKPQAQPAQQDHAQHKGMENMPGMDHSGEEGQEGMHGRKASGTAWQPSSTPGYMWMTKRGAWDLMAHGNLFLTYNQQGGPRGAGKLESMNWLMFMEHRKVGRVGIQFRQMFSGEPLTAPHPGFPQLFQTGETYHGQPLVDHQHPHDVFGELSVLADVPIAKHFAVELYGAPVGEPALGPVTFMHRGSASEIPFAPLGHHLEDSTHITAGVATVGLVLGKAKIEGSVFNGREPDEKRYTIDFAPMDSFSGRISVNPTKDWSLQYSFGHLRKPEALEPDTNIDRQTASVSYNRPLSITKGNWATTLLWGRNQKSSEGSPQNAYLLESVLNFQARNYVYTRLELVDKDELFPAASPPAPSFRIGAYTFGGVRDLVQNSKLQLGLGADVTFYTKPAALDPTYGDNPVSFRIFLRVRPGLMAH